MMLRKYEYGDGEEDRKIGDGGYLCYAIGRGIWELMEYSPLHIGSSEALEIHFE